MNWTRSAIVPNVTLHYIPYKIEFSELAMRKMAIITKLCSKEVSWLGMADYKEAPEEEIIHVSDIFILEQEVSAGHTEMTEDGLVKFMDDLREEHPNEYVDMLGTMRFWGHSHHTMGVTPSNQDESQMVMFDNDEHPFMIRCIVNKAGNMNLSLFHYEDELTVENIPWCIENEEPDTLTDELAAEIALKVSDAPTSVVRYQSGQQRMGTPGNPPGKLTNKPNGPQPVAKPTTGGNTVKTATERNATPTSDDPEDPDNMYGQWGSGSPTNPTEDTDNKDDDDEDIPTWRTRVMNRVRSR